MPNVRIEIRQGRSPAEKKALLEAVHRAKVEALKVPDHDRKQTLCEYSADDFEIPPTKTTKYTIIEITMFAGRSLSAKRHLYEAIVRNLGRPPISISSDDILIVLHVVPLENWGIGGHPASEVDLGFKVSV